MELKRIARDKDIPIITISSFNRDNYENEASFKSFKESGAIEYSSDVLIGLQKDDEQDEAKTENDPKEINLIVLKNRFGRAYKQISFKYFLSMIFLKKMGE